MDAAIIEEFAQKLRGAGAGASLVLFTRGGQEHSAHTVRIERDLVYLTHKASETVLLRAEIIAIRFLDANDAPAKVGF